MKKNPFEGAIAIGWLSITLSIIKSPVDLVEIYWIFAKLMNNLHLHTDFYYLSLLETIKIRIFLVIGGIILWVQNENSYPTGPILIFCGLLSLIISSISTAMHNQRGIGFEQKFEFSLNYFHESAEKLQEEEFKDYFITKPDYDKSLSEET